MKFLKSFNWFLPFIVSLTISSACFLIEEMENNEVIIGRILDFHFIEIKNKEPIILMFVGDVMLDRGIEYMVKKQGGGDWQFLFSEIIGELKKADFLVGNLESVVSDKGTKVGSIYSFRAEPESLEVLLWTGFDLVSVANNHIFDYGREAMEDSWQRLIDVGIDYIGGGFSHHEAHRPAIKEIGGNRIAFLAYNNQGAEFWQATKERLGIAWLNEESLKDIGNAKNQADLVIVLVHWGDEYQTKPNQSQQGWAQAMMASGADLIIGHHPHVVQPVEKINQSWVAYSLGNFIFDQAFDEKTKKGLLLEVAVKDGKIDKVIPQELSFNQFFQPRLASDE